MHLSEAFVKSRAVEMHLDATVGLVFYLVPYRKGSAMRALWLMLLSLVLASPAQAARLHEAAKSGDIAALTEAIAAGDDVNAREGNLTPIYIATQGGHIEAVRLLIKAGADPNQLAGFGYPLKAAITTGRADIIEVLLKGGANPNIERQSLTALHTAAESGCFDCVVLLVEAGADVNARTSERTTVIHLARRYGNQKIVDYLMAHGVSLAEPASILPLLAKADAVHGKAIFDKTCVECHTTDPKFPKRVGPLLWGIVGRKPAALDQFEYSEAMRERGGTWGYDAIGGFIGDPTGVIPGTSMGLSDWKPSDQDRADVVLYLRSLSDSPEPMP
jgi:cytochrome c